MLLSPICLSFIRRLSFSESTRIVRRFRNCWSSSKLGYRLTIHRGNYSRALSEQQGNPPQHYSLMFVAHSWFIPESPYILNRKIAAVSGVSLIAGGIKNKAILLGDYAGPMSPCSRAFMILSGFCIAEIRPSSATTIYRPHEAV